MPMDFENRGLPPNVYAVADDTAQRAGLTNAALIANGGEIAYKFPPYFNSLYAMESSVIDCYGAMARDYARIKFLMGNHMPTPPLLAEAVTIHRYKQIQQNLTYIEDIESERIARVPLDLIEYGLKREYVMPQVRMAELTQENISQHHRSLQTGFVKQMTELCADASVSLRQWAKAAGWKWSLRPLIAHPGNAEDRLKNLSHTRGLQNPESYLGIGNAMAGAFIETQLLDVFNELDDSPQALHSNYIWWLNSTLNGVIWNERDNVYIGLMPVGLLPQFLMPTSNEIPYYIQGIIPTSMIFDQVGIFAGLNEQRLLDTQFMAYQALHTMSEEYALAGQVLAICAACLTIACATLSTGRGVRKTQWMQSAPNGHLILHLRLVARYLIDKLNRYTAVRLGGTTHDSEFAQQQVKP